MCWYMYCKLRINHTRLPLPTWDASHKSQVLACTVHWLTITWGHDPSQVQVLCSSSSQNSGKHCICVCSCITKAIPEAAEEWPGGRDAQGEYVGRSMGLPCSPQAHLPPVTSTCSAAWKHVQNFLGVGFFFWDRVSLLFPGWLELAILLLLFLCFKCWDNRHAPPHLPSPYPFEFLWRPHHADVMK